MEFNHQINQFITIIMKSRNKVIVVDKPFLRDALATHFHVMYNCDKEA